MMRSVVRAVIRLRPDEEEDERHGRAGDREQRHGEDAVDAERSQHDDEHDHGDDGGPDAAEMLVQQARLSRSASAILGARARDRRPRRLML